MFNNNGISIKPPMTPPPDLKQSTPGGADNTIMQRPTPSPARGGADQVVRTTTPQPQPAAPQTPAPPANAMPGGMGPLLGSGLERALSQAASFFQGNKRDTVDEKERDKRNRNDYTELDIFGDKKLGEAAQNQMGGGGR